MLEMYEKAYLVTQKPRLVAVSNITTKVETIIIGDDGSRTPQEPKVTIEKVERWSIKAMVLDSEGGGVEKEFFFPTRCECDIIFSICERSR